MATAAAGETAAALAGVPVGVVLVYCDVYSGLIGGEAMTTIGVYEAKTQLPRLLVRVAQGERVTITRHGKPVAMLVPPATASTRPVSEVIADLRAFRKGRRRGRTWVRAMMAQGRR